jgi:hypothetical protein
MPLFDIFKRKHTVTFHLKSGTTLKTTCKSITIQKTNGNELVGYKAEGMPPNWLFYLRIDDVSAITVD